MVGDLFPCVQISWNGGVLQEHHFFLMSGSFHTFYWLHRFSLMKDANPPDRTVTVSVTQRARGWWENVSDLYNNTHHCTESSGLNPSCELGLGLGPQLSSARPGFWGHRQHAMWGGITWPAAGVFTQDSGGHVALPQKTTHQKDFGLNCHLLSERFIDIETMLTSHRPTRPDNVMISMWFLL